MTAMTFVSPAWLVLLALPVALLLAYLVRQGGRTRVVSSELLWERFGEPVRGRRVALPPPRASLLLALSILTLLALSAAEPWRVRGDAVPAVAVILDHSGSMATVGGNMTRSSRAKSSSASAGRSHSESTASRLSAPRR